MGPMGKTQREKIDGELKEEEYGARHRGRDRGQGKQGRQREIYKGGNRGKEREERQEEEGYKRARE